MEETVVVVEVVAAARRAWPIGSKKQRIKSTWSARKTMDSVTSKGYSISPSTSPGESTRSTHEKFLSLEVDISVKTFSEMPLNLDNLLMWS